MSVSEVHIRPGCEADLEALLEIYNHYVRATAITFDIQPITLAARREWLGQFGQTGPHRLFVAENPVTGRLLGYATAARFRAKPAYDTSVEVTIYTAPHDTGAGVGTALYQALFKALEAEDVHRAFAAITMPNPGSEVFHARFGFTQIGVMTEVGCKFGRYHDVGWWQKPLAAGTGE